MAKTGAVQEGRVAKVDKGNEDAAASDLKRSGNTVEESEDGRDEKRPILLKGGSLSGMHTMRLSIICNLGINGG